eukprot:4484105-Amphidinium_carterae.1
METRASNSRRSSCIKVNTRCNESYPFACELAPSTCCLRHVRHAKLSQPNYFIGPMVFVCFTQKQKRMGISETCPCVKE